MRIFTQKLAHTFVISSALVHLFCCGIPLLISAAGLATVIGVAGGEVFHSEWFEEIEIQLMIISGVILLISAALQYVSHRVDCRTDAECTHEPCDKKKDYSKIIFRAAIVLYIFNLSVFFFTH